jgi:hypothetical protein
MTRINGLCMVPVMMSNAADHHRRSGFLVWLGRLLPGFYSPVADCWCRRPDVHSLRLPQTNLLQSHIQTTSASLDRPYSEGRCSSQVLCYRIRTRPTLLWFVKRIDLEHLDSRRTNQEPLESRGQALIRPGVECSKRMVPGGGWQIGRKPGHKDGGYRQSQVHRPEI